jgi:hypothetical protein
MNSFLSELGKKIADRWLTLVFLPGLLFIAVLCTAVTLRYAHSTDLGWLAQRADSVPKHLEGKNAEIGLLIIGVILGSIGSGLLARWVALWVLALWLGRWRWPLRRAGRMLSEKRRKRAADAATAAAIRPIPAYLPDRPTWIGDRLRLIGTRLNAEYGVDLAVIWPRMWLIADDSLRNPVANTRERFDFAAVLTAWGALYTALGLLWWPSAIPGICAVLTGWRRGRTACGEFAMMVEALVDLKVRSLAESLGVTLPKGRVTPDEGAEVNSILGKGK